MIDSSANELNMSQETYDQLFKRQEDCLQQIIEDLKEKSNMFSSEHIQNKAITLRQFKAKIYPSDQKFEKQEEELIEFKDEQHDELRKFSSGIIKIKCFLSPMNIHLIQITLIENSNLRFLHMRKVLKTRRRIDSSKDI